MILENQWFWLCIFGMSMIIYLVTGRICDMLEHKYSMVSKMNNTEITFHSIEEIDNFIERLQKIKYEHLKSKEKPTKKEV